MRLKKSNIMLFVCQPTSIKNLKYEYNKLKSTKTLQKASLLQPAELLFSSQALWNEKSFSAIPDIQLNTPLLPYHYTLWSPVMFPEHQNSVHRERAKPHSQCNSIFDGEWGGSRSALSLGSDVRQGGAGQPSAIQTQSFIHPELKTLAVVTETQI